MHYTLTAMTTRILVLTCAVGAFMFVAQPLVTAQKKHTNAVIDLWMQGKTAFGVFVPNENAPQRPAGTAGAGAPGAATGGGTASAGAPPTGGKPAGGAGGTTAAPGGGAGAGQRAGGQGTRPKPLYTREGGEWLAMNPLYDYVFLNLEGSYDPAAIKAIVEGLRSQQATGYKSLIVRVPAFHEDEAAGRTRLREVFAMGADGITFPHVENVDEARRIIAAAQAEKIDVWSPSNPAGEKLLMMMIEDAGALAQAKEFADLKGYSILACGIGSLTGALGGDRAQAEAGNQKILAETKRAKLVNMLTANTGDVQQRVKEGFLALLMQGASADEAITLGRKAAGR